MKTFFALLLLSLFGISLSGPAFAQSGGLINGARSIPATNDTVMGTGLNRPAFINSAGNAIVANTSTTTVATYIVTGGQGNAASTNAALATAGIASCYMDSTIPSNAGGYYVINSTLTNATCHAQAAAPGAGVWVIGFLWDHSTSAGNTARVTIAGFIYGASGSGTVGGSGAAGSFAGWNGTTTLTNAPCAFSSLSIICTSSATNLASLGLTSTTTAGQNSFALTDYQGDTISGVPVGSGSVNAGVNISIPSSYFFTVSGGGSQLMELTSAGVWNQIANGGTVFTAQRATDSSPTGNFLSFLNAAGSNLFKVDVAGNTTIASGNLALTAGNLTLTAGALNLSALTNGCAQIASGALTSTGTACGGGSGSGINIQVNGGSNLTGPANFQNGTSANIVNFSNPTGSVIQATLQAAGVTNAMLANNTIGIAGTANQITSSTATPALGGTTTLAIANPFIAPGKVTGAAGTTSAATFRLPSGVAPTSPTSGDFWNLSGIFQYYDGTHTNSLVTSQAALTAGIIPQIGASPTLVNSSPQLDTSTNSGGLTLGGSVGMFAPLFLTGNGTATAPSETFTNTPTLGSYLALNPAVWTVSATSGTGSVVTLTLTNANGWTFNFVSNEVVNVTGVGTGYNCTYCVVTAVNTGAGTISYAGTGTASLTSGSMQLYVITDSTGTHKRTFNSLHSASANAAQNGVIQLGPSDIISSYDLTNLYTVQLLEKNTNVSAGDTRAAMVGDLTYGMVTAPNAPAVFNGDVSFELFSDYIGAASAPANPAAGTCRGYFNTSTGQMSFINSGGTSCGGSGGGGTPAGSNFAVQTNNSGAFGATNAPTTPVGVPQVLESTPISGSVATAYVNALPGVTGRAGLTTDTLASTDCNPTPIAWTGSSASTLAIPTPTTLAVPFCQDKLANNGSSTVTLTPTTFTISAGSGGTAGATLVLQSGQECILSVDQVTSNNWKCDVVEQGLTAGSNVTFTRSATGLSIATTTGAVSSVTGDGALLTNSGSTGAVTTTLATAGAHKYWGNNTGSTAAPGYDAIATGDLPSAIPISKLGSAGLSGTAPVSVASTGVVSASTPSAISGTKVVPQYGVVSSVSPTYDLVADGGCDPTGTTAADSCMAAAHNYFNGTNGGTITGCGTFKLTAPPWVISNPGLKIVNSCGSGGINDFTPTQNGNFVIESAASLAVANPDTAPTITTSTSGGGIATALTIYMKFTYVNSAGETLASPASSSVTTGAGSTNIVTVTQTPYAAGGGFLYNVYCSQDATHYYLQAASDFVGATGANAGPPFMIGGTNTIQPQLKDTTNCPSGAGGSQPGPPGSSTATAGGGVLVQVGTEAATLTAGPTFDNVMFTDSSASHNVLGAGLVIMNADHVAVNHSTFNLFEGSGSAPGGMGVYEQGAIGLACINQSGASSSNFIEVRDVDFFKNTLGLLADCSGLTVDGMSTWTVASGQMGIDKVGGNINLVSGYFNGSGSTITGFIVSRGTNASGHSGARYVANVQSLSSLSNPAIQLTYESGDIIDITGQCGNTAATACISFDANSKGNIVNIGGVNSAGSSVAYSDGATAFKDASGKNLITFGGPTPGISASSFTSVGGTGFFNLGCGSAPTGVSSEETQYCDSANQPHALSGTTDLGILSTKSQTAQIITADWSCGTGGTVSSCTTAQTIGTLTFTLPLIAANWSFTCDLVVGQATAATANSWNFQTATNGATNTTASYSMNTAATAMTGGATTDTASTTTTTVIGPTWTLGGTATKMPVHLAGTIEGASASGTVLNIQLVAPTVGDLVTIYRGAQCRIF